ncbi:hypothetical protein BC829DRAFT_413785 [Chytridium lagenaria]|nr:hypothetical protein BC829DRAFT_413785 [Chytridium lagenaria]
MHFLPEAPIKHTDNLDYQYSISSSSVKLESSIKYTEEHSTQNSTNSSKQKEAAHRSQHLTENIATTEPHSAQDLSKPKHSKTLDHLNWPTYPPPHSNNFEHGLVAHHATVDKAYLVNREKRLRDLCQEYGNQVAHHEWMHSQQKLKLKLTALDRKSKRASRRPQDLERQREIYLNELSWVEGRILIYMKEMPREIKPRLDQWLKSNGNSGIKLMAKVPMLANSSPPTTHPTVTPGSSSASSTSTRMAEWPEVSAEKNRKDRREERERDGERVRERRGTSVERDRGDRERDHRTRGIGNMIDALAITQAPHSAKRPVRDTAAIRMVTATEKTVEGMMTAGMISVRMPTAQMVATGTPGPLTADPTGPSPLHLAHPVSPPTHLLHVITPNRKTARSPNRSYPAMNGQSWRCMINGGDGL